MKELLIRISSGLFLLAFICASCEERSTLKVVKKGKYIDSIYLDQDSLPNGRSLTFYEDRLVNQSYYNHGLKDSVETIYSLRDSSIHYLTYKLGDLLNDRKVSNSGKLIYEFTYQHKGSDTVIMKKWYYPNSQLSVVQHQISRLGVLMYSAYYENGQLKERGDYLYREVNGTPEIEWVGGVVSLGIMKENLGAKHHDWFYYYPNGNLEHKEVYSHGKETGVWYYFDSTGTLIREKDFDKN